MADLNLNPEPWKIGDERFWNLLLKAAFWHLRVKLRTCFLRGRVGRVDNSLFRTYSEQRARASRGQSNWTIWFADKSSETPAFRYLTFTNKMFQVHPPNHFIFWDWRITWFFRGLSVLLYRIPPKIFSPEGKTRSLLKTNSWTTQICYNTLCLIQISSVEEIL